MGSGWHEWPLMIFTVFGQCVAKARKQEQQTGSEPAEPVDPRKAAVEAAIARAKARKQEQQTGSEPAEPADPRKAAVAAAIARVQAKKAAQQQVVNED